MPNVSLPILIAIAIIALYLINSIKILRDSERAVIFRLGPLAVRREVIVQWGAHSTVTPSDGTEGKFIFGAAAANF